jgi:predicted secreted hydrolase
MAFQMRDKTGASVHASVDARDAMDRPLKGWQVLIWQPAGKWQSASLAEYPLPMNLQVGEERFRLVPLMFNQEIDARLSTGGFYWEGAVSLMHGEKLLGRGYLELTGYSGPLRM